jgi:hypothetical protein
MIAGFLGYPFRKGADLLEEGTRGVFPVKEFPQVDARRVETKTMTGIGVKKNSPVVKLLPECDDWIR